ncbi:Uncharacterised protein [Vibrio cholerae]|nr:Uncharacterised protein [Vibrio cholerae]
MTLPDLMRDALYPSGHVQRSAEYDHPHALHRTGHRFSV